MKRTNFQKDYIKELNQGKKDFMGLNDIVVHMASLCTETIASSLKIKKIVFKSELKQYTVCVIGDLELTSQGHAGTVYLTPV